ncbi:hypothetical protein [Luteimonas saliphila]|uniref:hypothetical protein n=1 Tax=Luteimonas saliphila TaxID=2804919 RepID=UPI00192D5E2B|nr:hypothetical protein [Luteimonas saliphila]
MSYEERLGRDEIKHMASPEVGGMGMFPYEVTYDAPPGHTSRTEVVHATVALWTPHGRLLGSDRGEFGGELALASENYPAEQPKILYHANIEDLFLMNYGVLATTGYFHLSYDFGSVLLVTFSSDGAPEVNEIFKLPAGVRTSWVTTDDKVLVTTSQGTFAISSPTRIEKVRCKTRWWQII